MAKAAPRQLIARRGMLPSAAHSLLTNHTNSTRCEFSLRDLRLALQYCVNLLLFLAAGPIDSHCRARFGDI